MFDSTQSFQGGFFFWLLLETVQGQDDSRRDLGKVLTALPAKVSLKSPAFLQ